jgi:putative chitinase
MGNAPGSDDGYNFRGRGASQTTGREGYQRLARATGLDVVNHPEIVNDPRYFLLCGVADFINCGCLPFAKADDVTGVTRRLNGGAIGLAERKVWLAKWKAALGPVTATAPQAKAAAPRDIPAPAAPASTPSSFAKFIAAIVAAFRR